ncbi:glycosyltransferase [Alteromonas sp. ASW11-130]|uniref:glycosyltransferase n=1 Tax=Alteromonas sp. ASW11-130 TaxID=3015775 RepID=UPI00224262DF|nr:glycosyltransferase family 4 protein [Alteromonas sp. ASW11-130]MCW8090602.1 glycosyltransferase family 4 protein [Alteromonas sp. ASW11-130]
MQHAATPYGDLWYNSDPEDDCAEVLMKKRALIVGFVWPEPNSSAAGQNMMGIINALKQQQWEVNFVSAAADSLHKADITSLGVCLDTISLNDSSFDDYVKKVDPTLVIFDRFMTEEQFSWRVKHVCPRAMRVINTEDLHSLRHTRHQAIKSNTPVPHTSDITSDITQREIAAILRSDLTLIISEHEYSILTTHFGIPEQQLMYLPLLDTEFNCETPSFSQRHGFAWVGNFRHAPNWDATLQLKQHIWPKIKASIPDATLSVMGAYPPKKATQLEDVKTGFLVKGWVENIAEVLPLHRVMLAPIRFGAGIKGKLLAAMHAQMPSVTSSIGAEGIAPKAKWPGAVSDNWQEFAEQAIELYLNESLWVSQQAKIESVLSPKFASAENKRRFLTQIAQLLEELDEHRATLPLQFVLWHKTLRSTQYMSQWIEEKNKSKT